MSWSTNVGPVAKDAIEPPVPTAGQGVESEQADQLEAAKAAAVMLAKAVGRPGDEVVVTMSGHANPGHAPREGWAGEMVTVSVSARPSA